jgi:hypothetical protein
MFLEVSEERTASTSRFKCKPSKFLAVAALRVIYFLLVVFLDNSLALKTEVAHSSETSKKTFRSISRLILVYMRESQ